MTDKYILEGKTPVPESDLMTWATWLETADRQVSKDEKDEVKVSTVFLGLDHRFGGDGPPILFETMVFGGQHDQDQKRYCTWEEAEEGHRRMVEKVWPK